MLVTLNDLLLRAKAETMQFLPQTLTMNTICGAAVEGGGGDEFPADPECDAQANPDLEFFGPIAAEMARRSSAKLSFEPGSRQRFLKAAWWGFAARLYKYHDRPLHASLWGQCTGGVKEMVRICHELGLTVEAELGHVGMGGSGSMWTGIRPLQM